jgi:hypothetical protein
LEFGFSTSAMELGDESCASALGAWELATVITSRVPIANLDEDRNPFPWELQSFMQFARQDEGHSTRLCISQRFEKQRVICPPAKNKQKQEQIPDLERDIFQSRKQGIRMQRRGRRGESGTRALPKLLYHLCL